MSQSLASVLIHLIFSTKNRERFLTTEIEPELYAYVGAIFRDLKSPMFEANGTPDHVHLLFNLGRTVAIADLVEEVKKNSSKWIKTKGEAFQAFQWQAGYGAFSVSPSVRDSVRAYIANQKEHHRTQTFQDEFLLFLRRHGLNYDERYVWD